MKNYEKPIIMNNEEMSEGVYMASGCYTATAQITQTPELGREDYCIQVNGTHNANHTCSQQTLHLSFNQPVTYVSSNGSLESGDGTSTLHINYYYWNNASDSVGLGDVYVKAGSGLAVTSVSITDNGVD